MFSHILFCPALFSYLYFGSSDFNLRFCSVIGWKFWTHALQTIKLVISARSPPLAPLLRLAGGKEFTQLPACVTIWRGPALFFLFKTSPLSRTLSCHPTHFKFLGLLRAEVQTKIYALLRSTSENWRAKTKEGRVGCVFKSGEDQVPRMLQCVLIFIVELERGSSIGDQS